MQRLRVGVALSGADNIKVDGLSFLPELKSTQSLYEIVAPGFGGATVPSIRMAGVGDEMTLRGSRLRAGKEPGRI